VSTSFGYLYSLDILIHSLNFSDFSSLFTSTSTPLLFYLISKYLYFLMYLVHTEITSVRPFLIILLYYIILYYIILYYIILYYIILYYIILYYIILYSLILYYIILHYIILLYYIILYYIILYYIILYYIILYYIIIGLCMVVNLNLNF